MNKKLVPIEALDVLRQARWDKDATRSLELLSLCFYWSDELFLESMEPCMRFDDENYSFKYLMMYRESLIRGQPNKKYRDVWDQVLEACPDWPGFREDRCSSGLRAALDSSIRKACASFERFLRENKSIDE